MKALLSRTRMLCFLVVATLLGATLTVFGPARVAEADPGCVNGGVYIVFARGSGEHLNDERAHRFYISAKEALRRNNPGLPIEWVELGNEDGDVYVNMDALPSSYGSNPPMPDDGAEYPATRVDNWQVLPQFYGDSVRKGTDELVAHLNDRVARCSKESLLLGGYSQGADVVGWALQRTGYGSLNATTRSHIGYVALYGDPKFDPGAMFDRMRHVVPWWVRGNDNGFRIGPSGAFEPEGGILGARQPYMLNDLQGRVGSWCDSQDGVCTKSLPNALGGSHSTAYQNLWMRDANSINEVAGVALAKRNELNPELAPATGASYTIAQPAPPPPVIHHLKRTKDPDGVHQVYAATNSAVTEGWWKPNGDGVHTKEIIHISQDNIVGFDKTNLPEGKQAVFTAVPDGIWETWWDPQHDPKSAKIITGLTGVRQVIADNRWEGPNKDKYTHRLYVLADQGPYEYWWRDGEKDEHGNPVMHKNLLDSITGGVTMYSSTAPDGSYELYVATPTWVYELKWNPGADFHHRTMINISQGDINSLSKVTVGAEERLFTGTSTGTWQGKWVGDGSPANNPEVNGKVGVIGSQGMYTGNAFQIYILTASGVTEFWYTPSNAGNGGIMSRSQGDLTSFTKFNDGAAQQVYTGTVNGEVWETYWGGGASLTTKKLFNVNR